MLGLPSGKLNSPTLLRFLEDGLGVDMDQMVLLDGARLALAAKTYCGKLVQRSASISTASTGQKVAYTVENDEIMFLEGAYAARNGSVAELSALYF